MTSDECILIVEDEVAIGLAIEDACRAGGYATVLCEKLSDASAVIENALPRAIVLDRMLPDGDGLQWLRRLRGRGLSLPVLILTARCATEDRCAGLENGADDYLGKPFSPRELRARLHVLLRRAPPANCCCRLAGVSIDLANRRCDDRPLSEQECAVLRYFIEHPGRIVSRDELLQAIWGYRRTSGVSTRAVDMCMTGLRRKLGQAAAALRTVRGGGYRLEEAAEPAH